MHEQSRMIDSFESIRVPTFRQEHHREIDLPRLSENDLGTLRTQDPSMYHSIPAVHRATITLREVDNVNNLVTQGNCVVTRKSRTEGCMELLMEDFFDDGEIFDTESDELDFELLKSSLLNRLARENSSESIRVPTFRQEHHQEINLRRLCENDLRRLRTQDPFMYYSIPAVQRAAFTLQEVDSVDNLVTQGNYVVTRKSRVSTECHSSLLLDECLQDEEFESLGSALVNLLAGSVESDNEQQPEH